MNEQPSAHDATSTAQPFMPQAAQSATHAYLLRLWRSGANGSWRASLQSVRSGERHMFPDLETLFAFLIEHVQSLLEDQPKI